MFAALIPTLTWSVLAAPKVYIEPWGADSFRIRYTLDGAASPYNGPGALSPKPPRTVTTVNSVEDNDAKSWSNGALSIDYDLMTDTITASRVLSGQKVPLATLAVSTIWNGTSKNGVKNTTSLSVKTAGHLGKPGYYGFGEHEDGHLNHLGQRYDMETMIEYKHSRGGEVDAQFHHVVFVFLQSHS